MKDGRAFFALAVAGFGMAMAVSAASGKADAWDSGLYWSVQIPAMAIFAGIAGWTRPHRTWAWGVAIVAGSLGQLVIRWFRQGEIDSLWPVSLFFAGLVALACGAVARLAARLRPRGLRRRS